MQTLKNLFKRDKNSQCSATVFNVVDLVKFTTKIVVCVFCQYIK